MKKKTVLLVDDDRDFINAIKTTFESQNFEVQVADDGEAALVSVKSQKPDLVILDVMMPKRDGYSVCHEMKSHDATARIPVIMLTALGKKGEGKTAAEVLAKGHKADAFFEKPVPPKILLEKAVELIELSGKSDEDKVVIVLIDDDPDFVAAVKTLLEKNDYSIRVAYSGEEGILIIQRENPDLVLLDVMLPEKDGLALCKELKENEKTRSIPVILLTSVAEKLKEPDYAKALAVTHHADDYLQKPVDSKELLKRVRKFVGPKHRLI